MAQKALQVVRLLEDFKRSHLSESERNKMDVSSDDHRAPKRPWEDLGQDGAANGDQTGDVSTLDSCIPSRKFIDLIVEVCFWRRQSTVDCRARYANYP
jgi:hypothetical protein